MDKIPLKEKNTNSYNKNKKTNGKVLKPKTNNHNRKYENIVNSSNNKSSISTRGIINHIPKKLGKITHINRNINEDTRYRNNSKSRKDNIPILKDEPSKDGLTKEKLDLLQEQIIQLETTVFNCDHFICSFENIESIYIPRLWFLFELEMCQEKNSVKNLRNSCYHNKVYENIVPNWQASNTLGQPLTEGYEPFDIQTIVLPKLFSQDLNELQRKNNIEDINHVTVELGSFSTSELEKEDTFQKENGITTKKNYESLNDNKPRNGETFLSKRNIDDIFNFSLPLDAKLLVESSSSKTNSFLIDTNNLQENDNIKNNNKSNDAIEPDKSFETEKNDTNKRNNKENLLLKKLNFQVAKFFLDLFFLDFLFSF
ncbi:hypothetical protein TBLA_0I00370 [Henningerozyma blattae CBS 6284]|uniref:Uncharacterized protein n=1 Tax=Henningerozyma blattae (strain ATCC 34711 / CBS 6284 / DSM 70876 / NBRC 10599 / NRRL Y-10934 / UCD 77-7) TaxID=1071380 RepID=I2H8J8_HENB6|nr:hypothetical protein TBLA_0I00370 [Tetrapisispora blattae CBS 6284]CCH62700.1 hypothetical protein TBLA_0I00370 [Tetrapisispora blattae CBS 6284]